MRPSDLSEETHELIYCMAQWPAMLNWGDRNPLARGKSHPPRVLIYDDGTPAILEDKRLEEPPIKDFPARAGHPHILKSEARIPNPLNPQHRIIVADNVLVTFRANEEPSILFVMRDPKAPGGARLCCPGGWSGFEGPDQTALFKLDREIGVSCGGKEIRMDDIVAGRVEPFKAEQAEDLLVPVRAEYYSGQNVSDVKEWLARPYPHVRCQPDVGDDNIIGLTNIMFVTLPEGAHYIDKTGHGRTIHEVRLSEVPRFIKSLGQDKTLPIVHFVEKKLLPEIMAQPRVHRHLHRPEGGGPSATARNNTP